MADRSGGSRRFGTISTPSFSLLQARDAYVGDHETDIENFIKHHKRRKVKNLTIWHYVKDIRALFYWAMEKKQRPLRSG